MVESKKIVVKNLSAGFKGRTVLDGVHMNIPAHKVTAIVGPSGCGKSTFLNCLNRMIELHTGGWMKGDVYVDDLNVGTTNDLPLLRSRVGLIFQKPAVFPISIYDNIAVVLKGRPGVTRKDIPALVQQALEKAGLWSEVKDRLKSPAMQLSGGQQQRLCIARALSLNPDVLLFDEPCSQLDPLSSAHIEKLMVELTASTTVVLVTHNLQQAKRIADHCAVFWAENGVGRLEAFGETQNLWSAQPQSVAHQYLNGSIG